MRFGIEGDNPLSHVLPHTLKKVEVDWLPKGEFTLLSDQIVMMITAGVLLTVFFPILIRKRRDASETGRLVPRGFANAVEAICQYFRDEVARPQLGPHTDRFIKYIWSVFFFILTINLLGLLPIGTVTPVLFGVHIGGTATANIWVTGTLAVLTLILMVFNGLRLGGKDYLAHLAPGPLWLSPLMVFLEAIVGPAAKTFALTVRLFANMIAGHTLLAVIVSMILLAGRALGMGGGLLVALPAVLASVAITMLEIFVAFLQAYIFAYLTTLFIGQAVYFHHDDHGAAAH